MVAKAAVRRGSRKKKRADLGRITLEEVQSQKGSVDVLRIRSYEMEIYLVEVEMGGSPLLVTDRDGNPLKFRSQLAAKKPFRGLNITRTVLRHQSTYDEMIGHDFDKVDNALEVKLADPSKDLS